MRWLKGFGLKELDRGRADLEWVGSGPGSPSTAKAESESAARPEPADPKVIDCGRRIFWEEPVRQSGFGKADSRLVGARIVRLVVRFESLREAGAEGRFASRRARARNGRREDWALKKAGP